MPVLFVTFGAMIVVDYPEPHFRIRKEKEQDFIFDALRKQWLVLTPEEWVRQNFAAFLVQRMKYPAALIAVEKEILLHDLKKRFDLLVYNSRHEAWMLVECKAPEVSLTEQVWDQVLRYHISVPARFLLITNGNKTRGWEKIGGQLKEIDALPLWE